jgi:Arc/MetJ family transcription regulator
VYILLGLYTLESAMRTNIDIDDKLLKKAMKATGLKTKKAVVEEALEQLVREREGRAALQRLWGIGWEGDLDEMRKDFMPVSEQ